MSTSPALFIQMSLDLPDPYEVRYRFSALVSEHFADAPERDKPFYNLAGELLAHTGLDLLAGLQLCNDATETYEQLDYKRVSLPLNYMLYAVEWFNEADEGGLTFLQTCSQLGVSTAFARTVIADIFKLETAGKQHFLQLPPAVRWVCKHLLKVPKRKSTAPAFTVPPALKADAPKFHEQPALHAVWAGIARKGQAARRKEAREAL